MGILVGTDINGHKITIEEDKVTAKALNSYKINKKRLENRKVLKSFSLIYRFCKLDSQEIFVITEYSTHRK